MDKQSQSLPTEKNSYDVFASYASKDNHNGWITEFLKRLQQEHEAYFGDKQSPLSIFFDKDEIRSGHNWRHKLIESVQHSSLFIAFVSPNYFASQWCRREWRTWTEAEIGKHILSEGAHPVYIIEVPWLYQKMDEQQVATELENLSFDPSLALEAKSLAEQLSARQSKADVRLFYEQGQQALREEKMIQILQKLTTDLSSRAQRVKDAENSFTNVPAYNKHFTGRLTELNELRTSLDDRKTGVITSIQGLGGIGKTELAFTYAHAFASLYPGGRYYLKCEGHSEIRQPIINHLGDHFGKHLSEAERMDPEKFFHGIIATLQQHLHENGRTLFVLDNVDKESLLANSQIDQLTDSNGKLHLLATTRLGSYSIQNSSTEWLTLNSLPPADALALLYKFRPIDPTTQPEEHQAAQDIVTLLDGFTLTIELTAAYLGNESNQQATSYASVLEQFQADQDQTLEALSTDQTAQSIRHNDEKHLATILSFSLDRLTPIARTALAYAAHLPPDSICIPWLKELCLPHHPEINDKAKIGTPAPWQAALHQLESLAFLTTPETDQQENSTLELDHRIKRLHRLVAAHLLHQETEEQHQQREQEIDDFIQTRDEFLKNQHNWQQTRWEVEPLDALAWHWDEANHIQTAWLLNQVATGWHSLNDWLRAEPLMRRALAIDEQSYGEHHPKVATKLNNLATLLQATNRLSEAEPLMRRALAIDEQSYGELHPRVATQLNNLAQLLKATNRLSEAEPHSRRMVLIFLLFIKTHGHEHPHLRPAINNYACLLQATKLPQEDLIHKLLTLGPEAGWELEEWQQFLSELVNQ